MNTEDIKHELLEHCKNYVNERLQRVQNLVSDIQQSLTSETKSTAGDKHETGRAMLQLEREKAGAQLAEVQKLQEILAKITIAPSKNIRLGSLVATSQGNYFLSISAGAITVKNTSYFAIAANTPIGKLLLGKTAGETICFRDKSIKVNVIN